MWLEYASLVILIIGLTLVFYTFVYIHDIPYAIAKKRNHPQVEAIHVACWLSLFTVHALWPLVFLWAVSKKGPIEVAVADTQEFEAKLLERIGEMENRLARIEGGRASAAPENSV
ncbi:MAG: DUF3302 domain-containing protein [Alphaproteobacteria bacterium]|nr:DUF3302 domain-containing protein [Alphaproteobacteria bacterium]